ncbi:prolyl oligopeptidase family serine peptidase [Kangiella sp. TOML190]|uniref:prolyl oligopeptidase family serine peptidase n=1 Tax=Kangiella sp. TOML190 TaxID=2931351 RepID=UPI002041EFDA|nr:prolyl oligopeptidase family serine peptidase [Kangiella sp. TOML190]
MPLAKNLIILIAISLLVFACNDDKVEQSAAPLENPVNKTQDHQYQFQGIEINDPYHWLSQVESEDVTLWRQQQIELSNSFFSGNTFDDFKAQLQAQPIANYLYPQVYRDHYYFIRQQITSTATSNTDADSQEPLWQLFIYNNLSKHYQTIDLATPNSSQIQQLRLSPTARYAAYQLSHAAGTYQWKIYDISAQTLLDNHLPITRNPSSLAWFSPTKFIYSDGLKIHWANLFQPHLTDREVFNLTQELPEKELQKAEQFAYLEPRFSDDHRYIVIEQNSIESDNSQIWLQPLDSEQKPIKLVANIKASFQYLANKQDEFYFLTNLSAGRNRIISINLSKPSRRFWREVVAQDKGLLVNALLMDNKWLLAYKNNAKLELALSNLNGGGKKSLASNGYGELIFYPQNLFSKTSLIFNYQSLINPSQAYYFDSASSALKPILELEVTQEKNSSLGLSQQEIVQQLHFYRSQDGSRIPLEIIKPARLAAKKNLPTLLLTHNGFGQTFSYQYNFLASNFIRPGGQVAIAHIRGGGLYGQSWYRAGSGDNKHKALADLIAAQEWLLDKNFSSRDQSALYAYQENAYLFAGLLNHDPSLFSVAILEGETLDLTNQDLLEDTLWRQELGFEHNNKTAKKLLALSPYQNISTKSFPATLLFFEETNLDAWKYLARMQNHQNQPKPIIMVSKSADKFENTAKALYFLQQNLGLGIQ